MPDALFPPTLLVVLFGSLASLGWGVADFGGGLTSRSAPVLGVLFGSQAASLLIAIPLLMASSEPSMSAQDLVLAALGGAFGASGLGLLYHGLSVGRMGVVMPIAAVITAALPVVVGFAFEGVPPPLVIAGIVSAVVSVLLVARTPDAPDGRPSGVRYGVAAGLLFGFFPIVANAISDDLLVGPVVAIRMASIVAVAALILAGRRPWRVPRRMWPALVIVGLTDMAATAAYLAALAVGPLAVAGILTSLSNVVTVVLAALILRERIVPIQAAGVVAAGLAVVLIAASG